MRISIFGAGYVGLTTGACLANLGHNVICFDVDHQRISILDNGKVPFYEPGLSELVARTKAKGKLIFTTEAKKAVEFGDVIFNCVGTPSQEDGSADLKYVLAVAESVGKYAQGRKFLVNKSTVLPGTARKCREVIMKENPRSEVEVVSNPEFLQEGAAVVSFNKPDKIVVGTENEESFQVLRKVYSGRLRTYLPMIETDWETAELIKYANNSFLATKISFINEIANICDLLGADVKTLAMALGLDYRISPRFLNAGIGYGGSCFPKDVKAIAKKSREHGYAAKLLEEVMAVNERQRMVMVNKINQAFGGAIKGKTLGVLGLSFKPKTSDVREAPSLHIIEELLKRGALIKAFDPEAMEEAKKVLGERVTYCGSPEETADESNGLVIMTEWDDFRNLDLPALKSRMKEAKLFDGRNIYEPEDVREEGFEYYGLGRR